jgi:hypothetical protein
MDGLWLEEPRVTPSRQDYFSNPHSIFAALQISRRDSMSFVAQKGFFHHLFSLLRGYLFYVHADAGKSHVFAQGWRHRISPEIGVLSSSSSMTNQTSDEDDQSSQDNKKHPSLDTLTVMPRWVEAGSIFSVRLIRTLK